MQAGLSDQEAQEVVQTTLISVAKTMGEFKYDPGTCSFKGWLRHITQKRIVDQIRKRSRELLAGDSSGEVVGGPDALEMVADPAGPDLEAVWQREWEENLRAAALERLQRQASAKHFQIYVLHVVQGKSAEEVCAMVGGTVATVYVVKHRLSGLLKQILAELEEEPL